MSEVFWIIKADGKMGKRARNTGLFERFVPGSMMGKMYITPSQFQELQQLMSNENGKGNSNKKKMTVYNPDDTDNWRERYGYNNNNNDNSSWWNDRYKPERMEWDGNIIIDWPVFHKMLYYTRAAVGEISGFGKIIQLNGDYKIVDVKIFEQRCTQAHTTLEEDALSKFLVEIIRGGGKPEEWKLWWHTHNDFGASFSLIDENTIQTLSRESVLIATCMNKNGEIVGRVDEKGHGREEVQVIIGEENTVMKEACEKEVDKKVSFSKWNRKGKKHMKGKKITTTRTYRRWNHSKNEWEDIEY